MIKSPYCKSFFDEQGINILEHARLEEFIKITNCFAFEMGDVHSIEYDSISILRLNASGYGRLALIGLIYKYKEYEEKSLNYAQIMYYVLEFVMMRLINTLLKL